jgi:hypothetical protein
MILTVLSRTLRIPSAQSLPLQACTYSRRCFPQLFSTMAPPAMGGGSSSSSSAMDQHCEALLNRRMLFSSPWLSTRFFSSSPTDEEEFDRDFRMVMMLHEAYNDKHEENKIKQDGIDDDDDDNDIYSSDTSQLTRTMVHGMRKEELQHHLQERQLDTTGDKKTLLKRLLDVIPSRAEIGHAHFRRKVQQGRRSRFKKRNYW